MEFQLPFPPVDKLCPCKSCNAPSCCMWPVESIPPIAFMLWKVQPLCGLSSCREPMLFFFAACFPGAETCLPAISHVCVFLVTFGSLSLFLGAFLGSLLLTEGQMFGTHRMTDSGVGGHSNSLPHFLVLLFQINWCFATFYISVKYERWACFKMQHCSKLISFICVAL